MKQIDGQLSLFDTIYPAESVLMCGYKNDGNKIYANPVEEYLAFNLLSGDSRIVHRVEESLRKKYGNNAVFQTDFNNHILVLTKCEQREDGAIPIGYEYMFYRVNEKLYSSFFYG